MSFKQLVELNLHLLGIQDSHGTHVQDKARVVRDCAHTVGGSS